MFSARRAATISASALTRGVQSKSGKKIAIRSFSSTSPAAEKIWKVYLSGEIHSDWREVIAKGVETKNLPVSLSAPNTSHEDSDDCGAMILGMQEERPNWDKLGANMNAIRTLSFWNARHRIMCWPASGPYSGTDDGRSDPPCRGR